MIATPDHPPVVGVPPRPGTVHTLGWWERHLAAWRIVRGLPSPVPLASCCVEHYAELGWQMRMGVTSTSSAAFRMDRHLRSHRPHAE